MIRVEAFLFGIIVMIFLTGLGLSTYLHEKYWMFKQSTMGIVPKSIYITGLVCIGIIYATIIYYVFVDNVGSKKEIVLRFFILFASNVIFFALLYFILYLFNNQEYGKTDENVVIASTLQGRYLQMIYFSLVTFFTVGYSNLIPFGFMSRIINFIQILSAYIISAYIYSRSSVLFNVR